jgi:F0F1-type ATP synthase membrane subunit c/vacuolar-type H+-ATPase subunit K
MQQRRSNASGLYLLRQVFVSFCVSPVLFAIVIAFLHEPSGSALPWLGLLAVAAAVSIVLTNALNRPLDCSSRRALAGSYRTRLFLRLAFTEAVTLLAFVFSFIGAPSWVFFVAVAFAEFRLWTVCAPTRAALAADQRVLDQHGCGLSLVAALNGTGPDSG